ncbi:hypothetical protein FHS18_006808 [Paenibacillus phyllosphaerae]|uniref:Uncharacterized protein n=1 Tax=Paenibacillus phyllosphaerae TaxID=274593 RepID=A0A7W5B5C0_9BACL|nr:hypothetical protein [Paenibacillus phyllosphaerae]
MKSHLRQGWQLTAKHFSIVIILFLYELLWGFFLYRTIDSIVTPLLQRYPDSTGDADAVRLFLTEAQFQLIKTDLIYPYLWLFAGLLAARMLITPIFNAGLLHSLHYAGEEGTRFLHGIRHSWKPITLIYLLEVVLTLAPAVWVLPHTYRSFMNSSNTGELLQHTLPYIGGWFVLAIVLHLLFLAMQFGAVAGTGPMRALWGALKQLLPFAGISLIMWGIGILLSLTVASVSMLWAGIFALILHQGFHLVRTIMKVWTIAAQYDVWHSKQV